MLIVKKVNRACQICFITTITLHFLSFIIAGNVLAQTKTVPVEILTSTRSQMILNGQWQFQPVASDLEAANENAWGKIWVPGSWGGTSWNKIPGIEKRNEIWPVDISAIDKAWYQTTFNAPNSWKKQSVEITFFKISTDATVFVNGQKAGIINWYTGTINISDYIKYGELNKLEVLIIATANENEVPVLMGTATSQVSFKKATLGTKGMTGDVVISTKPKNVYVNDVFVKTSFREKRIDIDAELIGVTTPGMVVCHAEIKDDDGVVKKSFSESVVVTGADTQLVQLKDQWSNPVLWDLDNPHLYKLYLSISYNNQVQDTYLQTFGFREFWAAGKQLFLNGTRINLRPSLEGSGSGMNEIIDARINGLRKNGFNFSEIWPDDHDERGFVDFNGETLNRADKKGFLFAAVVLHFSNYIMSPTWEYQWDNAGMKEQFETRMKINLRRFRNHPSVVMWCTTGNFFGDNQDQNPVNIGRKNWITEPNWNRNAKAGEEAIRIIKKHDSTRLVFTHNGAYVGDLYTLNLYLNLLPLQEREEWMSAYSKAGEMPFMAVEFGTPLNCTFLRGRNGYGNNVQTEPLVTEFCAMYLGDKAYLNEAATYRDIIKNQFIKEQTYQAWHGPVEMEKMWSFQQVQKLFSTNTWRSWRTYGIDGGLLPWSNGHGWLQNSAASKKIRMPSFAAGRKGTWYANATSGEMNFMQPPAWKLLPAGDAITKNNNSTLAYIAGPAAAFTAKDNHFNPGQKVEKQLIFFNDTRFDQSASWECIVMVGNKIIQRKKNIIPVIEAGEKSTVAFHFQMPELINRSKADGKIILTAIIGGAVHIDTFHYRIYRAVPPSGKTLVVYDPVGKTNNMLKRLGYQTMEWKGEMNVPLVLIGREVLSSHYKLPALFQNYIASGGKAIVFNQHPDSVLHKKGFRTSSYISRYVFPVNKLHPVTKDLDEHDFRNWAGSSTITEAYPTSTADKFQTDGRSDIAYYGWHWGNRGGVSTGAIEKPHNSAWQPILEAEFDMAYSPLMELPYKNGLLIWCALDLEDHFEEDPVAAIVTRRLINYAASKRLVPRNRITQYIGDDESEKLLTKSGVQYNKGDDPDHQASLIICGDVNATQAKQLQEFVVSGGNVLVLPRKKAGSFMGVTFVLDSTSIGGNAIPDWEQTAGLSISDVRYRAVTKAVKISAGCQVAVQGMIGRKVVGKGTIIFTQFNPESFNADSLTYFRYTRWRQTRALSQVLANLGVSFSNDEAIFLNPVVEQTSLSLDGAWKVAFTKPLPGAKTLEDRSRDSGITAKATLLVAENADESGMTDISQAQAIELVKPEWSGLDGEMVYRKKIEITKAMAEGDLILSLSTLDDFDEVYVNGVKVGFTDSTTTDSWSFNRNYTVKAGLLKAGINSIAIRIFDHFGGGGTSGYGKRELKLVDNGASKPVQMYHADYRDDFELGDNPFRYFRW